MYSLKEALLAGLSTEDLVLLIEAGDVDPRDIEDTSEFEKPPQHPWDDPVLEDQLIDAIKCNDIDRVRQVLDQGVNPNFQHSRPYWYAYSRKAGRCLRLLIAYGADTGN